jgi:hypothetical protein
MEKIKSPLAERREILNREISKIANRKAIIKQDIISFTNELEDYGLQLDEKFYNILSSALEDTEALIRISNELMVQINDKIKVQPETEQEAVKFLRNELKKANLQIEMLETAQTHFVGSKELIDSDRVKAHTVSEAKMLEDIRNRVEDDPYNLESRVSNQDVLHILKMYDEIREIADEALEARNEKVYWWKNLMIERNQYKALAVESFEENQALEGIVADHASRLEEFANRVSELENVSLNNTRIARAEENLKKEIEKHKEKSGEDINPLIGKLFTDEQLEELRLKSKWAFPGSKFTAGFLDDLVKEFNGSPTYLRNATRKLFEEDSLTIEEKLQTHRNWSRKVDKVNFGNSDIDVRELLAAIDIRYFANEEKPVPQSKYIKPDLKKLLKEYFNDPKHLQASILYVINKVWSGGSYTDNPKFEKLNQATSFVLSVENLQKLLQDVKRELIEEPVLSGSRYTAEFLDELVKEFKGSPSYLRNSVKQLLRYEKLQQNYDAWERWKAKFKKVNFGNCFVYAASELEELLAAIEHRYFSNKNLKSDKYVQPDLKKLLKEYENSPKKLHNTLAFLIGKLSSKEDLKTDSRYKKLDRLVAFSLSEDNLRKLLSNLKDGYLTRVCSMCGDLTVTNTLIGARCVSCYSKQPTCKKKKAYPAKESDKRSQICNNCFGVVHFEPYFKKYICRYCGQERKSWPKPKLCNDCDSLNGSFWNIGDFDMAKLDFETLCSTCKRSFGLIDENSCDMRCCRKIGEGDPNCYIPEEFAPCAQQYD